MIRREIEGASGGVDSHQHVSKVEHLRPAGFEVFLLAVLPNGTQFQKSRSARLSHVPVEMHFDAASLRILDTDIAEDASGRKLGLCSKFILQIVYV